MYFGAVQQWLAELSQRQCPSRAAAWRRGVPGPWLSSVLLGLMPREGECDLWYPYY